jgi:hypothetical protein
MQHASCQQSQCFTSPPKQAAHLQRQQRECGTEAKGSCAYCLPPSRAFPARQQCYIRCQHLTAAQLCHDSTSQCASKHSTAVPWRGYWHCIQVTQVCCVLL